MPNNNSGPEVISKLKDLLRNQISLLTFHKLRYKGMNIALQRKIENTIDRAKIVQCLRLKHVERLIHDMNQNSPYKKDVKEELQTFWTAILPEIREVLKNFKDIVNAMKWEYRFDDIQIPDVLEFISKVDATQEPDAMSRITTLSASTGTHLTGRTRSIIRKTQPMKSPTTKRPKSRN